MVAIRVAARNICLTPEGAAHSSMVLEAEQEMLMGRGEKLEEWGEDVVFEDKMTR